MPICPRCGSTRASYELRAAGTTSKSNYYRTGIKNSWFIPAGQKRYKSKRHQKTVGICHDCGYRWEPESKSNYGCLTSGLAIVVIIALIVGLFRACFKNDGAAESISSNDTSISDYEENTEFLEKKFVIETDWLKYYEENNIYVIPVYADVMFDYGKNYIGHTADTVITIYKVQSNYIAAHTENDKSNNEYSLKFYFEDRNEIKLLNTGDIVEIVGVINSDYPLSLQNCHVVSYGNDAVAKNNELKEAMNNQIYYAEAYQRQLDEKQ